MTCNVFILFQPISLFFCQSIFLTTLTKTIMYLQPNRSLDAMYQYIYKHVLPIPKFSIFFVYYLQFNKETLEKLTQIHMLGPTSVKKKSYANKEGAWSETNPKEIMNFIALLVYQGSVKVSSHAPYWSTKLNHYTMAFGLENLCPEIDMPQF